ncbi:MAG: Por secretion system C-terminal sorting protein [Bacteroidota bacterium]|jgi:hypothetical protein|nr:Por secretion system C-terminal sorting protein [Bacteroidota bacterium]
MKKFYTLIAATAIVFSVNAQRTVNTVAPGKTTVNPKLKGTNDPSAKLHSTSRAGGPFWFNYGRDLDDSNNGLTPDMAVINFMNLFPDSTITLGLDANNNPVATWTHKAAVYLDPRFDPVNPFGMTDNYLMDSIGFEYAYIRNTDPTVVDTVKIQIIKENLGLNYQLTGPPQVYYQDITYNQPANELMIGGASGVTVLKEIKIPLTDLDTSSFNALMLAATPGIPVQTGGKKIGAVISFIPGYTWTQTDIVSEDKNAFYLVSLEQNGDNTDQSYYGNGSTNAGDMNMSYILEQDVRYDVNAQGWNGYFLPSLAYNTGYSFENHSVYFRLDNTTSIGVNEFVDGVKVAQNMPNPFSTLATISYQLEKSAAVSLSVYDVTGKKIAAQSEGTQSAGAHTLTVNAADLAAGVYYYTLTVGENTTSTMKMVVVK